MTNIGEGTFGSTGLSSVCIPSSVKGIGHMAFYGCGSLKKVISHIEEPFEIFEDVFSGYFADDQRVEFTTATLYVPIGTKTKYEATPAWNMFQNIAETESTAIKETMRQMSSATTPVVYSLSGQKQITPKKGLNIISGKKVMMK